MIDIGQPCGVDAAIQPNQLNCDRVDSALMAVNGIPFDGRFKLIRLTIDGD